MTRHQARSEPERTGEALFPDGIPVAEAFRRQDEVTRAFSEALRAGRCRASGRFGRGSVGETVAVLRPLAGAWSLEVVFLLYMHGPTRFNALRRALGDVSSRVLTDKLRDLEEAGFVRRGDPAGYRLSPRGEGVARHLHPLVYLLRNPAASRGPQR